MAKNLSIPIPQEPMTTSFSAEVSTPQEEEKLTCVKCGAKFSYPTFGPCNKKPGNHVVPSIEYFHLGARHVQSIRDRRMWSPLVILQPTYETRDLQGNIVQTKGVSVQFNDGKFSTDDPEVQFHLALKMENDGSIKTGVEGRRGWDEVFLSPEQQLVKSKMELDNVNRQIRENNALLEQVQKQTKG